MPLVISTALIVIANLLYAYVQSIDTPGISKKWWVMIARFIMGVGAGLCVDYIQRIVKFY
jgi:MFS family permease